MTSAEPVLIERDGPVTVISINRPEVRNAVDGDTAAALADAFREFEVDDQVAVAVLTGVAGSFCAGADLKAVAAGDISHVAFDGDGPMGPTRMSLSKPVIAAIEGHAVAGGLELAIWCDLRVIASDGVFGVFCRRWGVPLIDGGTFRLAKLIGQSRASDLILTGRPVPADEALAFGLANRVCDPGTAASTAIELAKEIASFPQTCLRSDLKSLKFTANLNEKEALEREFQLGIETILSGETQLGAAKFAGGSGRGGSFEL